MASAPPQGVRSLEAVEAKLAVVDPMVEVRKLLMERRFAEAFSSALNCGDVGVVAWLCEVVQPSQVVTSSPPLLSQPVLLSLLQQLGFDLPTKTQLKLSWVRDSAMALNPADPSIAQHVRPVLSVRAGGLIHLPRPPPSAAAAAAERPSRAPALQTHLSPSSPALRRSCTASCRR